MGIMITEQSEDMDIICPYSNATILYKECPSKSKPVYIARWTSAFHILRKMTTIFF